LLQRLTSKLPATSLEVERLLIDPESLVSLAAHARDATRADIVNDVFSAALHEMRIGGTWKRTRRGRLQQTERVLGKLLAGADRRPVELLDLGASDGITTLDLLNALKDRLGGAVRVVLADKSLWLVRFRRGCLVEYRASNGEPVLLKLGPFGLRLARQRQALAQGGDPLATLYLRATTFRSRFRESGRISLLNPALQAEPTIVPIEMDLLIERPELTGKFDAVRASNVLNLSYFTREELRVAVGNIFGLLRAGGCLVVSRNDDDPAGGESERGTAWQKEENRFVPRDSFGGGSEIADIVGAWRAYLEQ